MQATDFAAFWARLQTLMGDETPYIWATRIGIGYPIIQAAQKRQALPKADALLKICDACGVTLDWLIRGEGALTVDSIHQAQRIQASEIAATPTPTVAPPAVVQASPGRVDWTQVSGSYRREIRDLLVDVIMAVDAYIEQNDLDAPTDKRAQLISMLFDYMLDRPNFQVEDISDFFRLVA